MGHAQSTEKHLKASKSTSNKLSKHLQIGKIGEQKAKKYLLNKNYSFVTENWKIKYGEIDLIFIDNYTLVFVEVKTRVHSPYSKRNIFQNITFKKQAKLKMLVNLYLNINYKLLKKPNYRIDIVGVIIDTDIRKTIEISHIKGAIST